MFPGAGLPYPIGLVCQSPHNYRNIIRRITFSQGNPDGLSGGLPIVSQREKNMRRSDGPGRTRRTAGDMNATHIQIQHQ